MPSAAYVYAFGPEVAWEDVESALLLALFATEALHGETALQLETRHVIDGGQRTCAIDVSTPVGRDLNRIFFNFIRRENGSNTFAAREYVVTSSIREVRA